ncbi:acyl CoA:acetate/3-ketoacid CoA transferase [Mycetocola zhujimingii]|uniref:acyl CoA:acetate/3-ketoacid CoA transferase n=1 Tax=Mycetocola zhujimingii TaxID=2079792 RepID=UPI000D3997A0|nr:malonate decarboxylase subunit alpha [Mycetocola zhujimingii]AWB87655.1 hypothetical protein C3E77_14280 [Mycetocola zhujimingii]
MIAASSQPSRRESLRLSPEQAAELVPSAGTIAVGGSGSLLQVPESILEAIGARFAKSGSPLALDVVHVMGLGDRQGRGIDHLAKPGLTRRFIGSHFVLSPAEQRMIAANEVEAIGLPAGTISLLYREIAAGRPGLFTDIGLETFVDPRLSWGRMNACTTEGMSELVTVGGREWLFYPTFPIDVAIIRASVADEDGNLSMDEEAALSDNLAIAQAARNTGGIVIAEVKRVVPRGEIPAARVRVPGVLVDHVVETTYPMQTPVTVFDPARTGAGPATDVVVEPLPLTHLKTIARRAVAELHPGAVVNLGVGAANGISYVALEEGVLDEVTLTVEQGLFGGLPGIGFDSGTATNPSALIDMSAQFDFYDGGGLDIAGLGFAEVGRSGDVNVARVGPVPIGPGGFIDISQKADTVVFCGTFTGGGLLVRIDDGKVVIEREGRYVKFVDAVDEVAFSAEKARREGRRAVYVTERAVFELRDGGLVLTEVAPGISLYRDILDLLDFRMPVAANLKSMDPRIFQPEPMGIRLRPAPSRLPHTPSRSNTETR